MKGQRRRRESAVVREHRGLSLLAVQSIVCGVVLLIALLLRLIGGGIWEGMRSLFRKHITDDSITQTITEQTAETKNA